MKTAPVANPRQLTPAFSYAIQFCQYGWVASIDEAGQQCKSLAPGRIARELDSPEVNAPLYQVHELPVLDEVKSEKSACVPPAR